MQNDLPDDLDPVILGELQAKRARLQGTISTAITVNPDEKAKLDRIASFLDMPKGVAAAMPKDVERQATLKTIIQDSATSPVLQRKYSDADFAALAHDDSGALSAVASAARWLFSAPGVKNSPMEMLGKASRAIASGLPQLSAGLYGAAAAPAELLGADNLGGFLREQQRNAKGMAANVMGADPEAGFTERAVMSGFQSAGQNLAMMPFGLVGAGSGTMLGLMGASTGGESYGKARDAGQSALKSAIYGAQDATAEIIGEKYFGMVGFLKNVKAGASAGKLFAYELSKELPGEIGTTLWQNFNEWTNLNPDKPMSEFIKEQPEAIAQTIIATLVGGSTQIGAVKAIQKAASLGDSQDVQAQHAEHSAQVLQNIQQTMQASKLLERSPENLRTYMQDLVDEGVPMVYLDAAAVTAAGIDLAELAQVLPSVAEQIDQGQTGGDLAIPTGELLTNTIGTEYAQSLIDHARTSPEGMSRVEAQQWMSERGDSIKAEVERAVQAQDDDAQFKAGRDAVEAQVLEHLNTVGRFTPRVNQHYASLISNFYAVMAARAGVSVEQFAQTYALQFSKDEGQGGYDQGKAQQTDTPEFKQWFGDSKVVDADGKPLVVYHGTNDNFTKVNFKKGAQGLFWFASDKAAIESGEAGAQGSSKIMPLYASIQNPAGWKEYDKYSTDELQRMGYDGVILPEGDGSFTGFIFKDAAQVKSATKNRGTFDPKDANILHQAARGQIQFGDDITQQPSFMRLLDGADLSTFIHESGHFYLEVMADLASRIQGQINNGATATHGEQAILDDMNKTLAWMGVGSTPDRSALENWHSMTLEEKRQHHEQFARGFEAYAFEGKAPSLDLQKTFQTFRSWLVNVYRALLKSINASPTDVAGALRVELTDEVRGVMDRMLATSQQIEATEAARNMGPLFATAEQAGMSLAEFKAYHDLATQATMDAVDSLQTKGLRDMQWLSRARSRKLKELQKLHNALRTEVEREVRGEVMSQPVYRAWQFLTARDGEKVVGEKPVTKTGPEHDNLFQAIARMGGLRRDEVKAQWGIDEKETLESGIFGKPVVRKEGGLSFDAMAERLLEEGYLLPDENGKADLAKLEALFDDQRAGIDRYSIAHDMAAAYGDAPLQIPDVPDVGRGKLRTDDLRRRYGIADDAVWRKLSARRMTSDDGGLDADVVAEIFGFTSGDELVKALADAEPPKSVIEGRTDQRMLEEHGDLSTPAGLERAADMAVHNDARAKFVATELAALDKANDVREKVPGQRNTVDVLARAAKDYATATIAKLRVRDVRPGQYVAAEARAARAALKAVGDTAKAAEHKRNQLINMYAARAAYAAQDEIKAALEYFRRVQGPGAIPDHHHEQITALLAKFDLRDATNKSLDNVAKFRTWAKAQLDQGNVPPDVDLLLTPEQRKAYQRELMARNDDGELVYADEDAQALLLAGYLDDTPVRNIKDVTVEELRGLRDTIKQIEHIGRRTKKVLADKQNREFAAVVNAMKERITSVAEARGRTATDTRTPNDKAGANRLSWRGFFFSHVKAANIIHIMDGGDNGPVWEHLMMTANDAANGEVLDVAKAHDHVQALLKPLKGLGDITDKPQHFPTIGRSLNRQARIVMAMNMGNEGNMQRMLGGEGWTLQQIKPVLDTLTAADWTFVQGMWDYYETFRPRVGAMERLINGAEPEWVQAQPLRITTADGQTLDLRGGYAPIIYDPRASGKAASFAGEKEAKQMMQAARVASTVSKGFTKARVEEVQGRPLNLNLNAMIGSLQDTIHYLHWQPWIIDANRLIKALDAPIREHYGAEVVKLLREWAGDNAAGMRPAREGAERKVVELARNVSFAGLAFNVMSAVKQITGYSQSVAVIGGTWMGRGLARSIASPRQAYLDAVEKSDFMKKRATTRMRDLAEVNNTVHDQGKFRDVLDKGGYAMMLAMQTAVDVPTWWGAYEKHIDAGVTEERAIALADQAVIDAQGSGLQKDLAGLERVQGAWRLLTGFMSFMNTTMNVNYRVLKSDASVGSKAVDLMLVNVIPVALSMVLSAVFTPGDSGDDDPEKAAKKMAVDQLAFLLGQFVGFREIAQLGAAALGEPAGDYGGPAGLRMAGDILKLAKQVGQGEADDSLRKAAVNAAGDLFRLPAAQINRTITGAKALAEGETENPAALAFGFQRPH